MVSSDSNTRRKSDDARGRAARRPGEIPRRGWRDILLRVKQEHAEDNVSLIAAGVAFYWLLAIFPALAGVIAIYGLVTEPQQVEQQLEAVSQVLPQQAQSVMMDQARRIAEQSSSNLQLAVVLGFLGALWSAAKGMKALMDSLNIAYDQGERRGFFKLNGLALLLTLGAMVSGVIALSLVVALPVILGRIGLGGVVQTLVSWARWPLLALLIVFALGVAYRYGPDRDQPQWRWVNAGAIAATALWLVASGIFSWYVANFGSYNETYGSLGAIIILLMWFFITAYAILLGAELNAEMEHQTRADTTGGRPQPMGKRDAYVADTLGDSR